MNIRSSITTTALVLAGFGLWSYAGNQLREKEAFNYDPNPLGLKRSPYGQVIAMAIQAPIDADWHGVLEIHDMPVADEGGSGHTSNGSDSCSHDHGAPEHDCDDHGAHGDAHENCSHNQQVAEHDSSCSDASCSHDHGTTAAKPSEPLLAQLSKVVSRRTNPNPPTAGHKFYIRRQIEKKLRFAYDLDPSHYANYAAYNLFLTQTDLRTISSSQDEVSDAVSQLAKGTIRYCLREDTDPRPALTAAAAAYNILERQFISPENHSFSEMREHLAVMDFCLKRHFDLLQEFIDKGIWDRLSEMRQEEILSRSKFTLKLRDSAEKTIARIENENSAISSAQQDQS